MLSMLKVLTLCMVFLCGFLPLQFLQNQCILWPSVSFKSKNVASSNSEQERLAFLVVSCLELAMFVVWLFVMIWTRMHRVLMLGQTSHTVDFRKLAAILKQLHRKQITSYQANRRWPPTKIISVSSGWSSR